MHLRTGTGLGLSTPVQPVRDAADPITGSILRPCDTLRSGYRRSSRCSTGGYRTLTYKSLTKCSRITCAILKHVRAHLVFNLVCRRFATPMVSRCAGSLMSLSSCSKLGFTILPHGCGVG
jgi:hypothetical protein